MRPFEGIKVIDVTHVLAGPFAAYQLAVLGADVIKVEGPKDCDQSRYSGSSDELNRARMGTGYLAQASNKRSITLNLKTGKGRDILRQLAGSADVFVENYRAGSFDALGIGYKDMKLLNPQLVYCSMTAFGQDVPRGSQTAYDHAIQAISGIMASTGNQETAPMKCGAPVVDYSTGLMAAFAISSALFQRARTGRGQYIDCAMLDTAMMLQASHIANYTVTGKHVPLKGNRHTYAAGNLYDTKDGKVMLAASNERQNARLMKAVGLDAFAGRNNDERKQNFEEETRALSGIMKQKTAQEWEDYLQSRHVPATRLRSMEEALADPQIQARPLLHRHDTVPGVGGPVTVPMCAFRFEHGGASIEAPPPRMGEHNDAVLKGLGYAEEDIAALREEGVI